MGVPGLFPFVRSKTNAVKHGLNSKIPSGLCIDAVGFIYTAIEQFNDICHDSFVEDIADIVTSDIINVIQSVNAREYVLVAFDGVSPLAKMLQRKQRRWTTVASCKEGEFDKNSISAGTEFMDEIVSIVELKLKECNATIYFSSHRSPGEGEHKIFDFLRHQRDSRKPSKGKSKTQADECIVVYGNDADLMLLGLICDGYDIIIMRSVTSKHDPCNSTEVSYIHCTDLRGWLNSRMWPERSQPSYEDFVLITFLIGNDFIPCTIECEEMLTEVLQDCIDVYGNLNRRSRLTLVGPNYSIDWKSMAKFLKSLHISKYVSEMQKVKWPNDHCAIEYSPMALVDTRTELSYIGINHMSFKEKYYNFKLGLWGQRFTACNSGYDVIDTNEIVARWMQGMMWNLLYYKRGISDIECSIEFYYALHIGPSIIDVITFLSLNDCSKYTTVNSLCKVLDDPYIPHGRFLTPIQELMAILPLQSLKLLPKPIRKLLKAETPEDYPLSVHLDSSCKVKEFKSIMMVPPIDIDRIRELYSSAASHAEVVPRDVINKLPVRLLTKRG